MCEKLIEITFKKKNKKYIGQTQGLFFIFEEFSSTIHHIVNCNNTIYDTEVLNAFEKCGFCITGDDEPEAENAIREKKKFYIPNTTQTDSTTVFVEAGNINKVKYLLKLICLNCFDVKEIVDTKKKLIIIGGE